MAFDDQTETERARAGVAAGDEVSTVTGLVLLDGEPPSPIVVELKEDMQRVTGQKTLTIQPWMVGKNKGLANCVVTLKAKDAAQRVAPKPLERAELEKIGASFVPRIQVVTTGTNLVYRNRNSPCRCFHVSGRHTQTNPLVAAGEQFELRFDKPDTCQITSNIRPYMLAWIYVVDTPFYAVSDSEGRFKIADVPPGDYRVRVWHERGRRLAKDNGPLEITVVAGKALALTYKVRPKAESP